MPKRKAPHKKRESNKVSLFVGRWQPFHKGHKAMIETVLGKGKSVVVAIRDTELSKDNPYSVSERWNMIQRSLKKYGELVKIVVIPDIDEICYGRKVGYSIRQIDLSPTSKAISGTNIRKRGIKRHPIFWITGQSGSGKTTLANSLQKEIGGIVLDGDEMRKSISTEEGFSKGDRHKHNLRVARLAFVLSKQSTVIVSVITPFNKTRRQIDKIVKPVWIYIHRQIPPDPDKPYDPPKKYHLKLNSDRQTFREQLKKVLDFIKSNGHK